jgi:hypothetical protein
MAEDERQPHQKVRATDSAPSRNKVAEIFSVIAVVAAAAFAIYWYMPTQMPSFRRSAPQASVPHPPTRLSLDTIKPLLDRALEAAPVVVRVPLGDVVTVTPAGEPTTIYSTLADAGLIRLRFCRFPGANGPGREICLADLTETGRQTTAPGSPSLVIESGPDFPASNRSYAQFVVAQAKVKDIGKISEDGPNEATISYDAAVQPNPLASKILSNQQLPPVILGRAKLQRAETAWQIIQTGLADK